MDYISNTYIIKIQKKFRYKKLKKNYIELNKIELSKKTSIYNFKKFKKIINNNKIIINNFLESFSLYINKKMISFEDYCLLYYIYGYSKKYKKNNYSEYILYLSIQIINLINNLDINNISLLNNLYNYLIDFRILINFFNFDSFILKYDSDTEKKMYKVDNIINNFYYNLLIYEITNNNIYINKLVDEQYKYINNIYELTGLLGIHYLLYNLKKKIDINKLSIKIKNKISIYEKRYSIKL